MVVFFGVYKGVVVVVRGGCGLSFFESDQNKGSVKVKKFA